MSSQASNREAVAQRFESRIQLGSEFVSLYVQDLFRREHAQATSQLAGRRVTAQAFTRAVAGTGVSAAVLLDHNGRLLAVVPAKPELLGRVMTHKYAHLRAAVAGHEAVSNVVLSAARSLPVVGLADPYPTAAGRRVFSGAYVVSKTPLGVYLKQLIPRPDSHVYLVDAAGRVIAGSGSDGRHVTTLASVDPPLAAATRRVAGTPYDTGRGSSESVASPVRGTPWRIVASIPDAQLYATVDGSVRWVDWVALGGFGVAGIAIILMLSGLARGRRRLARFNRELNRLAHVDPLTGLKNRRTIDETLREAVSVVRRHGSQLSILMIDIDHFKPINDRLGHGAGDIALRHVARVLETTVRTEDVLARWGGEEFLVILPATDEAGAAMLAERLRQAVEDNQPEITRSEFPITITIGVAEYDSGTVEELVTRADAALYVGKTAGRNVVQLAAPTPAQALTH